MKKQYLISLLGIAAISAPVGSALISSGPIVAGISKDTTGTIAIMDTSEVTVFDMENSDGNKSVTVDDELESIKLDATFVPGETNDDLVLPKADEEVIKAFDDETEIIAVSYNQLKNAGGTKTAIDSEDSTKGNSYSLSLTEKDNSSIKGYDEFWNYSFTEVAISSGFEIKVTADQYVPKPAEPEDNDKSVGFVAFNEIANDYSDIEKVESTNLKVAQTSASVDYNISAATDIKGDPIEELDVKSVEWMDLGEDGEWDESTDTLLMGKGETEANTDEAIAIVEDGELTGTLVRTDLVADTTTNDSSILVTLEDDSEIKLVDNLGVIIPNIIAEPTNELTAINTDINGLPILSVRGQITTNGSMINSVKILDKSLKTDTTEDVDLIVGSSIEYNDTSELSPLEYEVHINDYDSTLGLDNYQVMVAYEDSTTNEITYSAPDDLTGRGLNSITEEIDLIEFAEGNDDSTDKLGGGAIFGIIVAVLLGVGLIAGLGYWLYKKYGNKEGSKS